MSIEPFTCSTTQTLNESCILGIVVGDKDILGYCCSISPYKLRN